MPKDELPLINIKHEKLRNLKIPTSSNSLKTMPYLTKVATPNKKSRDSSLNSLYK